MKRVSVTHKHTLRTQGAIEANDNSNVSEFFFYVPLTARSYGGVDLGLTPKVGSIVKVYERKGSCQFLLK